MKLYPSDKVRFISGLVLIVLIYTLYHIFFLENVLYDETSSLRKISRELKHLLKFAVTVVVYFVGTIHLGKLKDQWLSTLWHLVHISGLIIITSIGLIDWFIVDVSFRVRAFANNIQELLISPVLYVAMGLLNRSLKNQNQTT